MGRTDEVTVSVQFFTFSVTGDTRVISDRAWRRSRGLAGRGWLRLISPVVLIGIWQLLSATGVLPHGGRSSPYERDGSPDR
jgi:hypothetical protein